MIGSARRLASSLATRVLVGAGLVVGLAAIAPTVSATPFPGPDGFGYTGSVIDPNLRTLPDPTVFGFDDDQIDPAIPIGFTFTFYGVAYTTTNVSSNGFLSFAPYDDEADGCCEGQPLPAVDDINNIIAGYWTDLDPEDGGGQVSYQTIGTAPNRLFVVQYDTVGYNECDDFEDEEEFEPFATATLQIILHETTSNIEFQYGTLEPCFFLDDEEEQEGEYVSIGIENAAGTIGLEAYNGPVDADFATAYSNSGLLIQNTIPLFCAGMTFDRVITGTEGPDTLTGTGLRELILGYGGNDIINGGAGNDCIAGGDGNDTLNGGSGNDKIVGGANNDTIKGESGTDSSDGGTGTDNCDTESRVNCP